VIRKFDEGLKRGGSLDDRQSVKTDRISMGALSCRARGFKSRAQSGALFRVGSTVVPFCFWYMVVKENKQIESAERRWQRHKEELRGKGVMQRETLCIESSL